MVPSRVFAVAGALAVLAAPVAASAAGTKLSAELSGAAGGDAKGSGKFSAEADVATGDFCYTLSASGITPTMAHVHTGAAGKDGPPVITLQMTGDGSDECAAVEPDVLKAILAAPADYYVNVHTAAFPGGAIRGQLQASK